MAIEYSEKRQSVAQICIGNMRVLHRSTPSLHASGYISNLIILELVGRSQICKSAQDMTDLPVSFHPIQ